MHFEKSAHHRSLPLSIARKQIRLPAENPATSRVEYLHSRDYAKPFIHLIIYARTELSPSFAPMADLSVDRRSGVGEG
jgi:hypothetical protein